MNNLRLMLLLLCISIAVSKVCTVGKDSVVYDCKDITSSTDCTGSKGGVACIWVNGVIYKHQSNLKCIYTTCDMLSSTDCKTQFLQGQQCYLGTNGKCQGATSCMGFDQESSCTNFRNQLCHWDTSTSVPSCQPSSCQQITNADKCMTAVINNQPCSWYGNISGEPQCQVASCTFRSQDPLYCNGKQVHPFHIDQSGKSLCKSSNFNCRAMTCADFDKATTCTTGDAKIGDNQFCLTQIANAQTKETACDVISDCGDVLTKEMCEKNLFKDVTCLWDTTNICRRKQCSDITDCTQKVNGMTCTKQADKCTTCNLISNPCDCLNNQGCTYTFSSQSGQQACLDKSCSLYNDQTTCSSMKCFWNLKTLVCGDSEAETGIVTEIDDGSDGSTSVKDSTETDDSSRGYMMMITGALLIIVTI